MKKSSYLGMLFIVLILFAVSVPLTYGQEEPKMVWIARYNGPGNYYDNARAIAVGPKGNVYVTGDSYGSGTGRDYATVKYDGDGNEVWAVRYSGPGDYPDYAWAIAVDPKGNVYVTGDSYGSESGYDYATVKYDGDGNEVWVARYNGPGDYTDFARAIAVDSKGNVYVTGLSYRNGVTYDYATVKYDRDGNEVWAARYNGPGNDYDYARAIAVDPKGNVYVTGDSYGSGTGFDYATVKYDGDGNEVWAVRYSGSGNNDDRARAIAVDPFGNVYVTGNSYGSGTGSDYATVKYDRDGNEVWAARYSGPGDYPDYAWAIAVDPKGNVYVTGNSYGSGTGSDYATVRYDGDGNEVWAARYSGPGNNDDRADAIAVDPFGNVYVTGYSYGGGIRRDYATVKYDGDGNEVWVARYNGPGNNYDYARAIAVDSFGNVYVTGASYGSGKGSDYATIKYSK